MDTETVTILLVGDEKCGKTSFLSRISAGEGTGPVTMLRDIDQPFVFEIKLGARPYRLEFYDNNSPDSWKLLDPDVVVICYDISQRLSLINTRRVWLREVKMAFQRIDNLPILEAYAQAQEMRVDRYMECSAVTGELLKPAFEDICSTAVKTTSAAGGQSEGGCTLM
ncbi:GTP-binding protein rho1 like [Verticillium longisporum]|nr:GTP-binding protein rho1 like [Verticillium longisporum]